MYAIAERFPPLRERVHDWSVDRLLAELGRTLIPASYGTDDRDIVLVKELVKRDLTTADVHLIANRPITRNTWPPHDPGFEIGEELIQAGKGAQCEPFLREEILKNAGNSPQQLSNLIYSLEQVGNVDFSDVVIKCVRVTRSAWESISGALDYLEKRAHTRELYEALQQRPVDPADEAQKQRALVAIAAPLPRN